MVTVEPITYPEPGVWTQTATPAQIEQQMALAAGKPYALSVKANIGVRGFRRSAACEALDTVEEEADAPIIAALRQTGAVVVGIANMHELAFGVTSYNASYGIPRLPGHPMRSAGGSSGGSAAAVASGDVGVAVGTDTGGSISIPSSLCGVVGFRPSTGRWPTAGLVGLSWTRDTPGLFATSVQRVSEIDAAITGASFRTCSSPTNVADKARVGLPKELLEALHPATRSVFDRVVDSLARDVDFVEVNLGPVLDLTSAAEHPTVLWEAHRLLGDVASRTFGFGPATAFEMLVRKIKSSDVRTILETELKWPVSAADYATAQKQTASAREVYTELLAKHGLDALLFPTTPAPAPLVSEHKTVDHLGLPTDVFELYTRNTGQGTMLGAPMVTIPGPLTAGELPVGLTIQGARFNDRSALNLAQQMELALRGGGNTTSHYLAPSSHTR